MKKSIFATLTPKRAARKKGVSGSSNESRITPCPSSSGSSRGTTAFSKLTVNKSLETKSLTGSDEEYEDIEEHNLEYEATRKLLERKIEQAPAAKVIVSDMMMKQALNEIKARKSTLRVAGSKPLTPATIPSSSRTMSSSRTSANHGFDSLTMNTSDQDPSSSKTRGDGDGPEVIGVSQEAIISGLGNLESSIGNGTGCPLDVVLEFLQAVMSKDYKRALVLGKTIEQHEPNNEMAKEYMTVLNKIVTKEDENKAGDSEPDSFTDVSSSDAEDKYSDEMTTSSETDSISKEEIETSEESRSTTSDEDESDVEQRAHMGEILKNNIVPL